MSKKNSLETTNSNFYVNLNHLNPKIIPLILTQFMHRWLLIIRKSFSELRAEFALKNEKIFTFLTEIKQLKSEI